MTGTSGQTYIVPVITPDIRLDRRETTSDMKYLIDLDEQKVYGPSPTDDFDTTASTPLAELIDRMAKNMPFRTGLLPVNGSGLLSIQRGYSHEQIVYQLAPGADTVKWGQYEGSRDAKLYKLAMPWRVYIADFVDGKFLGCRHFWSPVAIYDWSQPLYAVGLPNTNTIGYSNNSVGWICLYHQDDTTKMNFAERVEYFLSRVNGVAEPYNNANMSSTDGPRFYAAKKHGHIFSSPEPWAAKTEKEGYEWVLDKNLLLPLQVPAIGERGPTSSNHAMKHVDGSPAYTLDRAANEPYAAYYEDMQWTKNFMPPTAELQGNVLSALFMGVKLGHKTPGLSKPKEFTDYFAFGRKVPMFLNPDGIGGILMGKEMFHCPSCNQRKRAESAAEVYTLLEFNGKGKLTNFKKSKWCNECINPAFGVAENIEGYDLVSTEFVRYLNLPAGSVTLIPLSVTCNSCGSYYHKDDIAKYLVYEVATRETDPNGSYIPGSVFLKGCVRCTSMLTPSGEYVEAIGNTGIDHITGKQFLLSSLRSHTIHELQYVDGALKVVDREVFITKNFDPCRCGLFEHGEAKLCDDMTTCNTCINSEGIYTPAFDFTTIPVEVQTSQLTSK